MKHTDQTIKTLNQLAMLTTKKSCFKEKRYPSLIDNFKN